MTSQTQRPTPSGQKPRQPKRRLLVIALLPTLALLAGYGAAKMLGSNTVGAANAAMAETSPEMQKLARELIDYHQSIELTAEEDAIKRAALEPLPAACCADNSAYTCCCPCNLSQAIWGLAEREIRENGANAEQVQAAVKAFYEKANPKGYEGFDHDACYTGGCGKSFADGGCGGMNPNNVVF